MFIKEQRVKDFLAHLRRNPLPEIMDEQCLAALASVEEQYGDAITHGAGLEVRLGDPARYTDYIMCLDEKIIPLVEGLWYEIDYEQFAACAVDERRKIEPCLFTAVGIEDKREYGGYWDKVLPPFMGARRAECLRAPLDFVTANLPEGARIKQIGTMTSRGEIDIVI